MIEKRERKAAPVLSRIRVAADFVVQIAEADLIARGIVKKAAGPGATQSATPRVARQADLPS